MNDQAKTPPSVGDLLGSLVKETGTLVRQEMHLASTELGQKTKSAAGDIGTIAVGGLVATVGLLMLAVAAVLGLAAFVPMWISALVLGVVGMGTGYAFISRGVQAVRKFDPTPERTVKTLHAAATSMKEQFR
jgi:hypothetical protein